MNGKLGWGMATLLALITTGLGCAQTGPMIRGQNPDTPAAVAAPVAADAFGPIVGSAPGYGDIKNKPKTDFKTYSQFRNSHFGYEGGYYSGPEGYYTDVGMKKAYKYGGYADGGCPHCQNGSSCPQGGCQHCGHGCPKHYMTYSYKWPQNQVYPPAVQPPAMVQYPYYTFRGPSDFFMQ